MKQIVWIFAFVIMNGAMAGLKEDLVKQVEHSGLRAADLGLIVTEDRGDQDEVIYSLNAGKRMVPASLTKLLTAGCVLETFPPHFQFQTELLSNAPIKDGKLQGSLFLKGGGDPSFVSESMWGLVNEFIRNDLTSIEGDVVVDDSRFDDESFDESRESKRVDRAYDAPTGAMSFNWNSINVFVRPGAKPGAPVVVKLDPVNAYTRLENRARTGKVGSAKSVVASRESSSGVDTIVVAGNLALGSDEVAIYKSLTHPAQWAGANLVEFLRQRGVTVKGVVKRGAVPASVRKLAAVTSKPIAQLVSDMAKFSNNFVAEMLTKNMAAEYGKQPATMKEGVESIRKCLDDVGLQRSQYQLTSPSGFTRDNQIAPQDMLKFLSYMKRKFTIFAEFLSALPIAGVDGTLKSRIKDRGAQWVRAKTGLLNGVVGLSGYAAKPSGTNYKFVFIYNGSTEESRVREVFDRMAGRLTQ